MLDFLINGAYRGCFGRQIGEIKYEKSSMLCIILHDLNLSPSNCTFWIIGMAPIFTFCLGMSYEHFDRKEELYE